MMSLRSCSVKTRLSSRSKSGSFGPFSTFNVITLKIHPGRDTFDWAEDSGWTQPAPGLQTHKCLPRVSFENFSRRESSWKWKFYFPYIQIAHISMIVFGRGAPKLGSVERKAQQRKGGKKGRTVAFSLIFPYIKSNIITHMRRGGRERHSKEER